MSTVRLGSVLVLAVLLCCARPPARQEREPSSLPAPVALVVERQIGGAILGTVLRRPMGVAVDSRGVGYLCDFGNNRILKFTPDLVFEGEIGGFGAAPGLFNRPTYLAVDNELNVLVADEGNRRVCRFNSRLEYVDEVEFFDAEDPLKFGLPAGIGATGYGELWIADRQRHRLAVFNNLGTFDRFIGEFGDPGGQLRSPQKIVKRRDGGFAVCDAGNSRIVEYDAYGNYLREIAGGALEQPVAATGTRRGLWVLDYADNKVHLFDSKARPVFAAGPVLPGTQQPLQEPSDLALLLDGRLLISDTGNDRLLVCRIILDE